MAVDAAGNLYIADQGTMWDPSPARPGRKTSSAWSAPTTGVITTVAGNPEGERAGLRNPPSPAGDGGRRTATARLFGPTGVALDAAGNLYIAESAVSRIRLATVAATSTVLTASPVATTTAVTSSVATAVYGQPITFTATVSPDTPGPTTPTGMVQFQVDGVDFGTPVPLIGGVALSASTNTLELGNHTVTAIYTNADGHFVGSAGTLAGILTINPTATTVTVASSSASPVFGEPITFTAIVSADPLSTLKPTGAVQFRIDGELFGIRWRWSTASPPRPRSAR